MSSLKIICPFTCVRFSLTLTADLTHSTIFKHTGGGVNEQQWLCTGCESMGHACAGDEGSTQPGRGWQPSNEVWNVMYDCITGQVREGDVILSAAALGIEVLSRFLFPSVCSRWITEGVRSRIYDNLWRLWRWGTSWNFMCLTYEGYRPGWGGMTVV